MSLVDQALAIPSNQRRKNNITAEEIELAIAWMKDEVSLKQVDRVRGTKGTNSSYVWLATCVRQAYREGNVEIVG